MTVKFICSEKATKFCEISTLLVTGTKVCFKKTDTPYIGYHQYKVDPFLWNRRYFHRTKVSWRFCKKFEAFSEYMNFTTLEKNLSNFMTKWWTKVTFWKLLTCSEHYIHMSVICNSKWGTPHGPLPHWPSW